MSSHSSFNIKYSKPPLIGKYIECFGPKISTIKPLTHSGQKSQPNIETSTSIKDSPLKAPIKSKKDTPKKDSQRLKSNDTCRPTSKIKKIAMIAINNLKTESSKTQKI